MSVQVAANQNVTTLFNQPFKGTRDLDPFRDHLCPWCDELLMAVPSDLGSDDMNLICYRGCRRRWWVAGRGITRRRIEDMLSAERRDAKAETRAAREAARRGTRSGSIRDAFGSAR